jgi:hypothetical protein
MGKTIRKFIKKGKKTQHRRNTKGKKYIRRKTIRRKTIRRKRKTGGGKKAWKPVNKKANEFVHLFYNMEIDDSDKKEKATEILEELMRGKKESCRYMGKKDENCEKEKENAYRKVYKTAKLLKLEDYFENLGKKINRPGVSDNDKYEIDKKLDEYFKSVAREEVIYSLIKSNPNHYLDEYPIDSYDGLGFLRIILDVIVIEKDVGGDPITLEYPSQLQQYIKGKTNYPSLEEKTTTSLKQKVDEMVQEEQANNGGFVNMTEYRKKFEKLVINEIPDEIPEKEIWKKSMDNAYFRSLDRYRTNEEDG